MNLKSEIAPKGIEFKPTEFVISGKNAVILTAVSYPKYINPGYLANITNISGVKIVAIGYEGNFIFYSSRDYFNILFYAVFRLLSAQS